jgi:hypothetical protein
MKSWSFMAPRAKLPQQALDELRSIIDNYNLLRPASAATSTSDSEISKLQDKLQNSPAQLWWSDLALAELCVAAILTGDQIRVTLPSWRRRLQDVVGSARYAQYIATAVDISQTQDDEVLRADLMSCIKAVYYFYGSYGVAALSRTRATERLIEAAVVILAFEAIAFAVVWLLPNMTGSWKMVAALAIVSSAAAVLGSVVSVQRRLQDPSVEVDPFYRFIQTDADWFGTAVISPLFGAIFGLLVYGLLVSQLVSTSIVKFQDPLSTDPLAIALPASAAGYAAIVILGFISGFAEQLIPDALTRIASRALASVAGSDPAPASGPAASPYASRTAKAGAGGSNDATDGDAQKAGDSKPAAQ